jgi:VanZ family protein
MPPAMLDLIRLATAPSQRRLWRVLLGGLFVAVTWLALVPDPPQTLTTGWDKSNHLLAFGSLAFTGVWAAWREPRRWWQLAAVLLAYGVGIEIAQSFLPPRSADAADVLADGLGIALGLLAAWPLVRVSRRS